MVEALPQEYLNDTERFEGCFKCSLCTGFLRECFTIRECLHSFCKSCIVLHYSTTKSCDCPECGLSLGTQPMAQVKYDHVKDSLVNKIFPQLRIHDEKLELAFYEKHNIPMDQQTKERLARVVETEQALNTI